MTAAIIDGKAFAAGVRARVSGHVARLREVQGITPGLAVVLVGFHIGLIFWGLVPNLVSRPLHMALVLPWIFVFAAPGRAAAISGELWAIAQANVLLLAGLAALTLFAARTAYSRMVLVLFVALNVAGSSAVRAAHHAASASSRRSCSARRPAWLAKTGSPRKVGSP